MSENTEHLEECRVCGELASEFIEGDCADCWHDRNDRHQLHLAQSDRWERMTNTERDREIREACR